VNDLFLVYFLERAAHLFENRDDGAGWGPNTLISVCRLMPSSSSIT
jgi:hypothetical protein